MDGNLPGDIIEKILLRLPVKSLLRFRSTSKSWNEAISSHRFAVAYLNHAKTVSVSSRNLFIISEAHCNAKEEPKVIELENQIVRTLEYPPEIPEPSRHLCYCDGLILADYSADKGQRTYGVWNPSAKTCMKFECPYSFSELGSNLLYGLCYDPSVEDYKAVFTDMSGYAVFYCRQNRWTEVREVHEFKHRQVAMLRSGASSANGDFYWVVSNKKPGRRNKWQEFRSFQIVCFNSTEEKFKNLSKPHLKSNVIEFFGVRFVYMGNQLCLYTGYLRKKKVGGSLVLCEQNFLLDVDGDGRHWWIQTDLDLCLPESHYRKRELCPLYLTSDYELLLEDDTDPYHMVLYDQIEGTFTEIWKNSKFTVKSCPIPGAIPFHGNLFLSQRSDQMENTINAAALTSSN